jgi:1-acyl-sn-glycerol-3-phosphate acyltransferase
VNALQIPRLIGTAFFFVVVGIAGAFLGGIVFPLLRLVPLRAQRRRRLGSQIVVAGFQALFRMASGLGVISYEIQGRERLGRPGQLILANHPSLLDAVFLIGCTPCAGCVVKAALWRNPFTAGVVSNAGYVPNAPTDVMIERAAEDLRNGHSLIMFPEGTRTRPGQPLAFHRGAAAVAIRAARVITPVLIRVTPPILGKHEPWYRIPRRRPHFSLIVGDDIDVEPFRIGSPAPRAARVLNASLLAYYCDALAAPGDSGDTRH